jgi:hypothetical protein
MAAQAKAYSQSNGTRYWEPRDDFINDIALYQKDTTISFDLLLYHILSSLVILLVLFAVLL